MYGRNFLSLAQCSREDLERILQTALRLKKQQKEGIAHELLKGKTLAMVFQKPSNRTRVSFEVGMFQLGGKALIIRPDEIQMGERESVADISRVFSRYVDAVMMRVLRHRDLEEFAQYSSAPVINGLSDLYHPCQAISDMLTIYECRGKFEGLTLCYVGDGNNVCNSLIFMANLLGMRMVVSCPPGYEPCLPKNEWKYEIINDPAQAISGSDVVYTDVWTSMGQEQQRLERLRRFEGYCITNQLFSLANPEAIFLHCLPAHRGEEVSEDMLDHPRSRVFDQAENRLHAQKAILALILCQQV